MARGEVDAVIVGADRICANGDVVNKVGTYAHALGARAAGLPFVVVAPESTVDPEHAGRRVGTDRGPGRGRGTGVSRCADRAGGRRRGEPGVRRHAVRRW